MPTTERTLSASSLPGRRIISRITSQFGAKTRNVHEYYIALDEPHKQHSGGDQVTGTVHLKLNKPVRITHLVVCLHGYAQVYKNPGQPPSDNRSTLHIGTGRSKSGEYFGNGFASLFEDEVVLCGDGKLDTGDYEFQFELEFPEKELPSNISFERGTISYQITATLTRPTTISPTIQCEKKVFFVEKLDISNLLPPKPRTITLEPISKRHRARNHARKLVDSEKKSRKTDSNATDQRRESQTSSSPSLQVVGADNVNSSEPSEISFESQTGSQGRASQQDSNTASPRQSEANKSKASLAAKTITAEVEMLMGGCLRGDHIPVRIHVDHTKHVKSLHGVIITLYRQARVDMHPAIPVGPTEKGKEAKFEDYYPKSLTGLGGLSLSGAGSSHTFRKDLSQTIIPLIVDKSSLTADVTGRVPVPEEAFASISSVPGAMIGFRYYVEVVIDIQGKLSSQDRNLGNLGGLASTINQTQIGTNTSQQSAYNPIGIPVIDTAAVKRDKGVVYCTFEIVVGTQDSERRKGKRKVLPTPHPPVPEQAKSQHQASSPTQDTSHGNAAGTNGNAYPQPWYGYDEANYYNISHYDHRGYPIPYDYYDHVSQTYTGPEDGLHNGPPVPMPQVEDESQLTEKERLRRAEARLLPSQPPGSQEHAVAGASVPTPTAPYLPEVYGNGYVVPPAAIAAPPVVVAGSARGGLRDAVPVELASSIPLPSTPQYEHAASELAWTSSVAASTPAYEARNQDMLLSASTLNPGAGHAASEDKRELERRRLQVEESAPPMDEVESSVTATNAPAPSAPLLTDDDELYIDSHDSHADASGSADLPRYER